MRILVDGQAVPVGVVTRRGPMNYGQPFPPPAAPLPYQLVIDGRELVAAVGDLYAELVQDEIADAPFHQKGEWAVLDRLQELGYPPLEMLLLREPEVFAGLVGEVLKIEVLDRLLPWVEAGLPTYLINTVNRVTVADGQVRIEGGAYLHPQLAGRADEGTRSAR